MYTLYIRPLFFIES